MQWKLLSFLTLGRFKIRFTKEGISYDVQNREDIIIKNNNDGADPKIEQNSNSQFYLKNNKPESVQFTHGFDSNIIRIYDGASNATSDNRILLINEIKKYLLLNKILKFLIIFDLILLFIGIPILSSYASNNPKIPSEMILGFILLFVIVTIVSKIIYRYFYKVRLIYEMDDFGKQYLYDLDMLMSNLISCDKIWEVHSLSKIDLSVRSAAKTSVNTLPIKANRKAPYFLRSNIKPYSFASKKSKYYLFPDMLFVISSKKFNAFDKGELDVRVDTCSLQVPKAPKDAKVIGANWKYSNKDGTADKRFKTNYQIPVILVPELYITTESGLDTCFYLSSAEKSLKFMEELAHMTAKYEKYSITEVK